MNFLIVPAAVVVAYDMKVKSCLSSIQRGFYHSILHWTDNITLYTKPLLKQKVSENLI
jgi:hypothetical protein